MTKLLRNMTVLVLLLLFGCSSGGGDGGTTDTPPPEQYLKVVSSSPADGATKVYVGSTISVTFDDTVDSATTNAASFTVTDQSTTTQPDGSFSLSADQKTVTFTLQSGYFTQSATYAVNLTAGIKSGTGNPLTAYSFSFSTTSISSIEPLELYNKIFVSYSPLTIVDLRDSSEIAGGYIAASTFVSYDDILSGASFSASKSSEIVIISSDGSRGIIAASKLVSEGYSNVNNLNGGVAGWVSAGYPLQDGSDGAFTVTSITPESGSLDVLVNQAVSVTFSNDVNPATVTGSTFYVKRVSDGALVLGALGVSGGTVTFTPDAGTAYPYNLYYPGEQYHVIIENVSDFNNNILPLSMYVFTTTDYNRMTLSSVRGLTTAPNDNYYIVDLRDMDDIDDGLIKYCNYVTYATVMSGDFEFLPADKTKNVIFISQDGRDSEVAASFVTKNGYTSARSMEYGVDGWIDTGYSLTNIYFTEVPNYTSDGPLFIHFSWDTIASTASSFEYKLEKDGVTTVDWKMTTSRTVSIYVDLNGYYILSLRIYGDQTSTILRGFTVTGCG